MKKCECSNGIAANSDDCINHASEQCSQCDQGYFLNDDSKLCELNQCTCVHGIGAKGKKCPENGTEYCDGRKECETGYRLEQNMTWDKKRGELVIDASFCTENECVCNQYGKGAVGTSGDYVCENDGDQRCGSCFPGFYVNVNKPEYPCEIKVCVCDNGYPHTGSACEVHGSQGCFSCLPGFQLDSNESGENCSPIV